MGFSETRAWYLQLYFQAVRTGGLWSADVLGRMLPPQGMPWGVERARDIWQSPEIGQRDQVLFMKWKEKLICFKILFSKASRRC